MEVYEIRGAFGWNGPCEGPCETDLMKNASPFAIRRATVGLAVIFGWLASSQGFAANFYWTNTPSGDFTNAANWTAGTVPGIADTARFTNCNVSYGVSLTAAQTNTDTQVNGAGGIVFLGIASDVAWVLTNGFMIGSSAPSSTMFLTGGVVQVSGGSSFVGNNTNTSTLVVTGPGAILTNSGSGAFNVGANVKAPTSRLVVTNGGRLYSGAMWVAQGGSQGNSVLVADSNSLLQSGVLYPASQGSGNSLVVSNGGRVVASVGTVMGSVVGTVSTNNQIIVTGSGSLLTNSGANFNLQYGAFQSVVVEQGGRLISGPDGGLRFILGGMAAGSNNTAVVRDSNSLLYAGILNVGFASQGNRLVVSNGGQAVAKDNVVLGNSAGSDNNSVWVTGLGSLLKGPITYVGSNATSKGINASLLIDNGATLESPSLVGGYAGTGNISNLGGIYRFTASPSVTTNQSVILLQNGAVEFVGVANAGITNLFPITFTGTNALRLINSTNNTSGLLSFSVGSGQNFQELQLVGTNSRWAGNSLLVTNGGSLVVSNASGATVAPVVTNLGAVRVVNSKVTWQSNVVLSGSYFSDPSTNTFASDLTVTASGSLSGSNGDLFAFYRGFVNQSTNRTDFNLANATVLFTNGLGVTNHVFNLSGSESIDKGSNWVSVSQLATNFSLGTMMISLGNTLQLTGGVANALYVGQLDLGGLGTNLLGSVLDLDVNLYYDPNTVGNGYLNGLTYDFAGWDGALIPLGIPIPEPSSIALILLGALSVGILARRRA